MDFSEIEEMEFVKDLVLKDKNLSRLMYYVTFYDGTSKQPRIQKTARKLRFGNKKADSMQKVHIDVYRDKVSLHYVAEGAGNHEREIDMHKKYKNEDYIIQALDQWKCDFTN